MTAIQSSGASQLRTALTQQSPVQASLATQTQATSARTQTTAAATSNEAIKVSLNNKPTSETKAADGGSKRDADKVEGQSDSKRSEELKSFYREVGQSLNVTA